MKITPQKILYNFYSLWLYKKTISCSYCHNLNEDRMRALFLFKRDDSTKSADGSTKVGDFIDATRLT